MMNYFSRWQVKFGFRQLKFGFFLNEKWAVVFIAGRPKAALLFWFFGGFRCGVPLFIIMFVIY